MKSLLGSLRVGILFILSLLYLNSWTYAAVFDVTNGVELQAALNTAESNGEGDTINLDAGTYNSSDGILGTFAYTPTSENFPLTLVGAGPDQTILDGGDTNVVMLIRTYDLNDDSNANISVSGLTFQNGLSSAQGSGGLFIWTIDADITLEECYFLNNQAIDFGGGVELLSLDLTGDAATGNIVINRCLMEDNTALQEGGGALAVTEEGDITITNSIFNGNSAVGSGNQQGGGLETDIQISGTLNLTSNTFYNNSAGTRGGGLSAIANDQPVTTNIYNNIFFNNTAPTADDIYVDDNNGGGVGSLLNLFNNNYSEFLHTCTGGCTDNFNEGSNINQDPLFVDAVDGDFNLQVGSPAIDAGDSTAPGLTATDFAGNPRVVGDETDMGALETDYNPGINVLPINLNFGSVIVGETSEELELTITNAGDLSLTLTAMTLSDTTHYTLDVSGGTNPCTTHMPTLNPGEDCTVTLTFTPDSAQTFDADITFSSNDSQTPELEVPLTGEGFELVPGLNVNPTSLDFGSIVVGNSSAEFELTLINGGDEILNLTAMTLSEDTTHYALNVSGGANPCTSETPAINPGENCTVTLTFTPDSPETFEAAITFSSNDRENPELAVPLTGMGEGNPVPPSPTPIGGGGCQLNVSSSSSGLTFWLGAFFIALAGSISYRFKTSF